MDTWVHEWIYRCVDGQIKRYYIHMEREDVGRCIDTWIDEWLVNG